ncbi:lytic transglycosylase domain-containing protein [Asticcacaulis machinosus]|uniref:Transglycosylase SLT domain-containing protein n=1 Tax=Asticcacaulis machinosus TaxID=2984211 RepID=A0ABT5HK25_9CAUL|nr:transglycosylase SLT domain-containing protein [Asticcacaulis machinosus]MDC7676573.1 transglycosylase SLT domain-containing protein [Asticcacaulis machinosus]
MTARPAYAVMTMLSVCTLAATAYAQVFEVDAAGNLNPLCTSLPPIVPASSATTYPFQAAIDRAAEAFDLSPDLIAAIIRQESGFNPSAISPRGAIGLMQLMPATARELGVNAYDPEQNIHGGAAYLRQQLDRFNGKLDVAMAAYNAGAGAVNRYGGIPPYRETRTYIDKNLDSLAKAMPNEAKASVSETTCS